MKNTTILAAVLLITTLGAASIAGANSNGILSGRYVGSTTGLEWFTTSVGSVLKFEFSSSYIGYFDGRGNFYGNVTTTYQNTNASGTSGLHTLTQTGTYTLDDDDTGTLSVQTEDIFGPFPQLFNIYATQGGNKVCFTQTNNGYPSGGGTINSIVLSGCYEKQ